MSENGIRLSGKPIWGGYVLWKENLSELQEILKELEDRKEELKDANLIEEENLRTKKQVEKLSVQNQLYDKIQKQTARQSTLLAKFMEAYAMEENEKERKKNIRENCCDRSLYKKTQQSYPHRRAECNVSDKRAGIMLQGNDKESGMESCGSSFCHFSG